MRPRLIFAIAVTALVPGTAAAQTQGRLPRVLELPASTRAMALGEAYVLSDAESDALFYHPALVAGSEGFALSVQRWADASTSAAASATFQWLGGGVGIGLTTLQYGAPGVGRSAAPPGQDHLFELDAWPVSERVAVLAYGRELFGVELGVAAKAVEARVAGTREAELMVDLSAATEAGPLTVGLTIRDWGDEPIVGDGDAAPQRVLLGAATDAIELGPLDVGVAASTAWADGDLSVAGGVELGYWPLQGRTFIGRLGLQQVPDGSDLSPLSFGLAFHGDEMVVEWAFRPYGGDSSGTHRFGVGWRR